MPQARTSVKTCRAFQNFQISRLQSFFRVVSAVIAAPQRPAKARRMEPLKFTLEVGFIHGDGAAAIEPQPGPCSSFNV